MSANPEQYEAFLDFLHETSEKIGTGGIVMMHPNTAAQIGLKEGVYEFEGRKYRVQFSQLTTCPDCHAPLNGHVDLSGNPKPLIPLGKSCPTCGQLGLPL